MKIGLYLLKKIPNPVFPLVGAVAITTTLSSSWAGPYSMELMDWNRFRILLLFIILFTGYLLLISVVESLIKARDFVDKQSRQVDVLGLWRSMLINVNLIAGFIIVLFLAYGVISSSNLSEVYRINAGIWHDDIFWNIESPLFSMLRDSWLNIPEIWDEVYYLVWSYLFITMAVIFKFENLDRFVLLSLATVIAFYITRLSAIAFPTAGPVFYKPELFDLSGTVSAEMQEALRLYMLGKIQQNGLIPGTMAMPSLHVGLTGMAAWFLASCRRWTLWFSIPWLILIWLSTIMLGWHYALDGVGGLLVVLISVVTARKLMMLCRLWNTRINSREIVRLP